MIYSNEKEFQIALIKRLNTIGFYVRNIPDIGNTKKPFDLSANYMWLGAAFELKIVKTQKEPTPEGVYKMLYPHQVANLLQFKTWLSQGVSLVFAYHDKTNKTFVYWIQQEWTAGKLTELASIELGSMEFPLLIDLIFKKKLLYLHLFYIGNDTKLNDGIGDKISSGMTLLN